MPYIEEVCVAGNTIEISKYYTYRTHTKGEKRQPKDNPTCEAQKRVNLRRAERDLRRLMNANFEDGDLLVTFDFYKEFSPPGSKEMQKYISKFLRQLKDALKKEKQELKYIYVKEVGPRGSRHWHCMMSRTDLKLLSKYWKYGGIHIDPLHTGEYSKVAAYFVKYASKTEQTEGTLIGRRWTPSRNLRKPKVKKRVISTPAFRKRYKKPKGYHLIKDSVREGISEFTGYEYFSYTLIKTDKEGGGG